MKNILVLTVLTLILQNTAFADTSSICTVTAKTGSPDIAMIGQKFLIVVSSDATRASVLKKEDPSYAPFLQNAATENNIISGRKTPPIKWQNEAIAENCYMNISEYVFDLNRNTYSIVNTWETNPNSAEMDCSEPIQVPAQEYALECINYQ